MGTTILLPDGVGEINFSPIYQINDGIFRSSYAADQVFNCKTGMIGWQILGSIKGEFRPFSERAIVIHKPQVECRVRGFNLDSWAQSALL